MNGSSLAIAGCVIDTVTHQPAAAHPAGAGVNRRCGRAPAPPAYDAVTVNASTSGEIDAAFATLARAPPDALFVAPDGFLTSRGVQFATLAARDNIPAAYADREAIAAGGLMSYGTDARDAYRQAGVYTGNILKGAKPEDLPVMQSTKFNFAINLQTAKLLGIEVPETLFATADELIK
jgi:putative ABC transport system substrate-binding protein